jgi:DNA-binding transcriptional MerR regulator
MNKLVDAAELARLLGVTTATIHAWHRRNWIPCLRAGRRPVLFDVHEVQRTLRERGSTDTLAALVAEIVEALRAGNQELAHEAQHKLQSLFGVKLIFADELGVSNDQ